MSRLIHARRAPDGTLRFREWSTVADGYTTAPMDRDGMRAHLLRSVVEDAATATDARLDRATTLGTSALDACASELDEPWETERCDGCGDFHHAFVKAADGKCAECSMGKRSRLHGGAERCARP